MLANNTRCMLWLLMPLVLALPFAMDIYVPAIPGMTVYFYATPAVMQLTLNLFMLVSGMAQIFMGPLADHFGRRRLTLWLTLLFIIGCGVCAMADHISVLILGRVIQALGSCGMMVMAFTIAKDLFDGVKLAKSCSYLNMVVACSPMFAPFVGSYLHIHWGWRANFLILVLMGVVTYLLHSLLLPETTQVKQPMRFALFSVYWQTMKDQCFLCYAAASAFGLTYIFLFCAMSPVILMTHLGVPEAQYGYYFAFMGISFLLGSMIANILVSRVGIYRTVLAGFVLSLVGGMVMFAWYALYGMSTWNFVIPMLIVGSGGSCAMSAGSAGAISHISSNTGLASSLCTGLRFSFAAVMGLLVSQHVHNTLPLSVSAVVLSCMGLVVFFAQKQYLDDTGGQG